jgi:hypothetical protein
MFKTNAVTRRSKISAAGSQIGRRSNSVASSTTQQERRERAKGTPNERGGYPRRLYGVCAASLPRLYLYDFSAV